LDEVVVLHRKDVVLGEPDCLLEDGGIGEVKHHPAFDLPVTGDLEEVSVRQDCAGCRPQLEEAVYRALSVADGYRDGVDPAFALLSRRGREDGEEGERRGGAPSRAMK
jgi:hypothetical protein